MTFIDILYTIFIGPLQLVFEIIYAIANRFIGHPGLAIIALSLIMNFLVLPLYKMSDALNGSVSLLLEVPFFMATYNFLSNLELIQGVSLGPIADLGAQDGLLVIGGVAINLLPVIMTVVNIVSSVLYLKGFPLKTKSSSMEWYYSS